MKFDNHGFPVSELISATNAYEASEDGPPRHDDIMHGLQMIEELVMAER